MLKAERALVFGRANGVWDEIAAAKELCDFDLTIAVGVTGIFYPEHVDAWVTFHPEAFPAWQEGRVMRGGNRVESLWTAIYRGRPLLPDLKFHCERIVCSKGSSGLLGALVAVEGYHAERTVLCGIPMEAERGQFNSDEQWNAVTKYRDAWSLELPRLLGKVRSMSGWTQKLLGVAPTREWLATVA